MKVFGCGIPQAVRPGTGANRQSRRPDASATNPRMSRPGKYYEPCRTLASRKSVIAIAALALIAPTICTYRA